MSVQWPLCFKYTGSVIGNRFVAHIDLCGRVLAEQSVEGVWFYGVTPAAIAVSAETIAKAASEHREALTKLFIDFAQEADGFASFKAAVEAFYATTDDQRQEWDASIERMQATKEAGPEGLQRCPDPEIYLKVTPKTVEQLTPDDNLTMADSTSSLYAPAA